MDDILLIYVADAMCSWCWGFAPVVTALRDRYADQLTFRLVMGGLRPGPAAVPLDHRMKAYLREHWEAVRERTGQPFDYAFLERDGLRYDTEPAARAVVTMRQLRPAAEFDFFHRLQRVFYAENTDITQPEHYRPIVESAGLDWPSFQEAYDTPATLEATRADYDVARALGISGFPSLVLQRESLALRVTNGYMPLEAAGSRVDEGLKSLRA